MMWCDQVRCDNMMWCHVMKITVSPFLYSAQTSLNCCWALASSKRTQIWENKYNMSTKSENMQFTHPNHIIFLSIFVAGLSLFVFSCVYVCTQLVLSVGEFYDKITMRNQSKTHENQWKHAHSRFSPISIRFIMFLFDSVLRSSTPPLCICSHSLHNDSLRPKTSPWCSGCGTNVRKWATPERGI